MKELYSLHYLRFISVAVIVLFHCLLHLENQFLESGLQAGVNITKGGGMNLHALTIGVDILFFSSGFLITYLFRDGWQPKGFVINRAIRIVPLYWILTVCFLVILFITRDPAQLHKLTPDIIIRSFFLLPQYTPSIEVSTQLPILYVAWFLSYELAFYSIFAFCLFLYPRHPGWLAATVLFLFYWLAYYFKYYQSSFFLFGMAGEYVFAIITGILAAELFPYLRNHRIPALHFLVIAAVVWTTIQLYFGFSLGHRFYDFGLPATVIAVFALSREKALSKSRLRAFMKAMSQSCYSIYLIQVFTIPAMTMLLTRFEAIQADNIFSLSLIYVVFTLATGFMVHRIIEKPLSKFLRDRYMREPKVIPHDSRKA